MNDIVESFNKGIPLIDTAYMKGVKKGKREKGVSKPRSYKKFPLSDKEKDAVKYIKIQLIESGRLEKTETGDSDTFNSGLFLIHHPRHLRGTVDGKVHGLRIKGSLRHGYPPQIIKEGQQMTTCLSCDELVLLHIDYQPGDVPQQHGAYCLDCIIGHPDRRIPLIFIDSNLRFKTVYNRDEGAYITNEGVMRSYMGEQWRQEYDMNFGDSINFYRVIEDPSGLFIDSIFVEVIKAGEKSKFIDVLPDIMTIVCENCGIIHKLYDSEIEEASQFIIKNKLMPEDFLAYMILLKGNSCKNGSKHKFQFDPIFEKELKSIVEELEAKTKELSDILVDKNKDIKDCDNALADRIKVMEEKETLENRINELRTKEDELTKIMEEKTKNANNKTKKSLDIEEKVKGLKDKLYSLTRISDPNFWIMK